MNPSATTVTTTSLDPITLEVIRNKLDGIANEMETTLFKSDMLAGCCMLSRSAGTMS